MAVPYQDQVPFIEGTSIPARKAPSTCKTLSIVGHLLSTGGTTLYSNHRTVEPVKGPEHVCVSF